MRDEHRVSEVAAIEFAARCRTERDAAAAIRMCEARENIISKQKRKVVSSTQTTNVEVRGEKITSDKACVVAQRNNKQAETERVVAQINCQLILLMIAPMVQFHGYCIVTMMINQ